MSLHFSKGSKTDNMKMTNKLGYNYSHFDYFTKLQFITLTAIDLFIKKRNYSILFYSTLFY